MHMLPTPELETFIYKKREVSMELRSGNELTLNAELNGSCIVAGDAILKTKHSQLIPNSKSKTFLYTKHLIAKHGLTDVNVLLYAKRRRRERR